MEVTKDKYELPVAVVDSISELARMVGTKQQTVSLCLRRQKKRKSKYVEVEIEEGEEND